MRIVDRNCGTHTGSKLTTLVSGEMVCWRVCTTGGSFDREGRSHSACVFTSPFFENIRNLRNYSIDSKTAMWLVRQVTWSPSFSVCCVMIRRTSDTVPVNDDVEANGPAESAARNKGLLHQDRSDRRRKFLLTVFVGGTAGCIAKTILAPLEMIRILVQAGSPVARDFYGKVFYCRLQLFLFHLIILSLISSKSIRIQAGKIYCRSQEH